MADFNSEDPNDIFRQFLADDGYDPTKTMFLAGEAPPGDGDRVNLKDGFSVTYQFPPDTTGKTVKYFMDAVKNLMPEGVEAHVNPAHEVVGWEELDDRHVGNLIRFVSRDGRQVSGTLDGVYPSGGTRGSATLVINGEAWRITYEALIIEAKL